MKKAFLGLVIWLKIFLKNCEYLAILRKAELLR